MDRTPGILAAAAILAALATTPAFATMPALAHANLEEATPAPMLTLVAVDGDAKAADAAAVGDLEIARAWARAMLPGQPTGGGYLTIGNDGDADDRLVAVSSPAAGKVEIHSMNVVDDVMTMRPVEDGLEIPAGGTVELKPGGLHLMFMDVDEAFAEGGSVPVTLEFEEAGSIDIELPVRAADHDGGSGEGHSNHDH